MRTFAYRFVVMLSLSVLVGGCSILDRQSADSSLNGAVEIVVDEYIPFIGGDEEAIRASSYDELQQFQLVSTNIAAAMTQVKELNPSAVTLQVRKPRTAFGNILIRTLEVAGYGLQLVSADQGAHYVRYTRRLGESDSGPVRDFVVSIGEITLSREYVTDDKGRIFPASLLSLTGTTSVPDLEAVDTIFKEQGGDDVFISGLDLQDEDSITAVSQVKVKVYDEETVENRMSKDDVLQNSKVKAMLNDVNPELEGYEKFRRTVLIFDSASTEWLGTSNKRAVGVLAREYKEGDLYVIKACIDIDGSNQLAQMRAVRVEEELISYGLAYDSTYISPCVRASYRHPLDKSPNPVDLTHYRRVQ